jgi:hypothetical protein
MIMPCDRDQLRQDREEDSKYQKVGVMDESGQAGPHCSATVPKREIKESSVVSSV